MVGFLSGKRYGPIGVDLGSRSVKLMQFNADFTRIAALARWELPVDAHEDEERDSQFTDAIRQARMGRKFFGRDAVLCLGARDLFVQNIRVPKSTGAEMDKVVHEEAATRVPFAAEDYEVRYLEAADVRQGDSARREVILLACRRPAIERLLKITENAGLRPIAIDAEPSALLRCYSRQYRRDTDKAQHTLFAHIGASNTVVAIARDSDALLVKYLDVGSIHLDEAVARHLQMDPSEATALRRHNGDRRADQRDPEIVRSVAEATRPVIDRLARELSLCIRYHSVTFRGQRLSRLVLGGGEANDVLVAALDDRLDVAAELGDPLRSYDKNQPVGRTSQWDVAAGLALHDRN